MPLFLNLALVFKYKPDYKMKNQFFTAYCVNTKANYFELIDFIKRYNNEYRFIVNDLASEENERRIVKMLSKEFFPFFIQERNEAVAIIVKTRFKKIREV